MNGIGREPFIVQCGGSRGVTSKDMKIVLRDATVRTLVEFLMATANKVDASGANMGHMFGPEPTVGSRGVKHGALENVPVDVLNGDVGNRRRDIQYS